MNSGFWTFEMLEPFVSAGVETIAFTITIWRSGNSIRATDGLIRRYSKVLAGCLKSGPVWKKGRRLSLGY